jgi:hypothetical protein
VREAPACWGFGPTVAGEIVPGESGVAEETRPDRDRRQRYRQPGDHRRHDFGSFDQELLCLLAAYLHSLFDVRVHQVADRRTWHVALVELVKLWQHPAQNGPQDIGGQPRNPIAEQQPVRQRRLANPAGTSDEEHVTRHNSNARRCRHRIPSRLPCGPTTRLVVAESAVRDPASRRACFALPGRIRVVQVERRVVACDDGPRTVRRTTTQPIRNVKANRPPTKNLDN